MNKLIREFLSYSRSERRGVAVLLAIVIAELCYLQFAGDDGGRVMPQIPPGGAALLRKEQVSLQKAGDTSGYRRGLTHRVSPAKNRDWRRAGSKQELQEMDAEPLVININEADSASFMLLRGIGRVLSSRIVRYRNLLGGFVQADQLREVYGIDSVLYESIRGHLAPVTGLTDSLPRRINLNTADFRELARHPYIAGELASAILSYRKRKGSIGNTQELLDGGLLGDQTYTKLKPYITAE